VKTKCAGVFVGRGGERVEQSVDLEGAVGVQQQTCGLITGITTRVAM
jgi:hypothetical protein